VPSSLMLSVTTHITTNIAPIPLLWVIPLAIYLLTFVLAFSRRTAFLTQFAWQALPFAALIPLATMLSGIVEPPGFMLLHLAAFAVAAMLCHGELAASRPGVDRLTEFYVWLAIGGAIGGLFNVVIAPILFQTLAEYPLGLVLACLLRQAAQDSEMSARDWMIDIAHALGIGILTFVAARIVGDHFTPKGTLTFAAYVFAVPAAIALIFYVWRPIRFALAVAAMSLVLARYPNPNESLIATKRSFYGVYRVIDRDQYRVLLHGTTNHGAQLKDINQRCWPLSYYYPTGPLGELFSTFKGPQAKSNIGIVGLGTGSIGGYASKGQVWTFYEIDPAVEDIARNPNYFDYLSDCVPQARVVIGDARISLATQPDAIHDVLVIDAFSSDAIPLHLLTREAMALYVRKLAPNGVLAFHISNRYFNLQPPLARLARDAGLFAGVRVDGEGTPDEKARGKTPSTWVVMARSPADLGALTRDNKWQRFPPDVAGDSWSDNYSNVLEALQLS
jgi:SAM-dependent methyltransferase